MLNNSCETTPTWQILFMASYHACRRTFISSRWGILQYTKEHPAAGQRYSKIWTITCSEGVWEYVNVNAVTVKIMMVSGGSSNSTQKECIQNTLSVINPLKLCTWSPFKHSVGLGDCRYAHMSLWGKHDRLQQFSGFHWKDQDSLSFLLLHTDTQTHRHTSTT